jgi:hypothetical protein
VATNVIDFKVLTPPAIEPVTTQEVKRLARVNWGAEDTDILGDIVEAREWLEGMIGRALITQTCQAVLSLVGGPVGKLSGVVGEVGYPLDLPYAAPLQSVTKVEIEVQVENWFTLTQGAPDQSIGDWLADTDSEPGRVWLSVAAFSQWSPSISYPAAKGALPRFRVTYIAGYGADAAAVPATIKQDIRRVAAWRFDHRTDPIPDSMYTYRNKVVAI